MSSNETSKKSILSDFLFSMHRHHQWLFIFGLVLMGIAVVISSFTWATKNKIILPVSGQEYSHPTIVIIFIALLLINSMVFALIAATHGALWFRVVITCIVGILLIIFAWRSGALSFILLPVFFMAGYVLWRGSRPVPGHPTLKDMVILYFIVFIGWFITAAFGIRLEEMSMTFTLYIGVSQLLVFVAFLPIPQILVSGIELAELTHTFVERLSSLCARMGNQGVLITLLATSLVKVGFILYRGGFHSLSRWIVPALFLLCFFCIVLFTPKPYLHFRPRFKHWIFLTVFIFPIPIGVLTVYSMLGGKVSTGFVDTAIIAIIGPVGLILAGVLAFFPKRRPFAIFTTLMAIWGLLTFSLAPLSRLIFGITVEGLNIWYLDGIAAILFILWCIGLLYQRKSSTLLSTALRFSFFLSGCFMLDQLLKKQFVIAELYTVFQILTYLTINQFIARQKQLRWSQVIMWIVVIILLIHSLWIKILPDGFINMITIAILIISMLWDALTADEKITGNKMNGPDRLALLFLYLAAATWTMAQIVFAKTGKGTSVLEWEPLLLLGFFVIGVPWVMYNFIKEIKV